MFLKMLKSDLKQKKGLSIVLFLFITAASVLVFVSGVQIYQFFTSAQRNSTACKSSDMIVYSPVMSEDKYEKELENPSTRKRSGKYQMGALIFPMLTNRR